MKKKIVSLMGLDPAKSGLRGSESTNCARLDVTKITLKYVDNIYTVVIPLRQFGSRHLFRCLGNFLVILNFFI